VSRDNICKTQCSFVLNSLDPDNVGGHGQQRPHQNFFIESDTLQAPGFFGDIFQQQQQHQQQQQQQQPDPTVGGPASTVIPRPFRGPTTALGGLVRPPIPPKAPPLPPGPPRAPRPPIAHNGNPALNGGQILPPPPLLIGAVNSQGQIPQVTPSRQPRPLFNFIPRLPNFSELFGI
jgi:hypothetical protein